MENQQPTFIRPRIGSQHRDRHGILRTIVATWQHGVVFRGGPCVTAADFLAEYRPLNSGNGVYRS
jgi:hypothetical protein